VRLHGVSRSAAREGVAVSQDCQTSRWRICGVSTSILTDHQREQIVKINVFAASIGLSLLMTQVAEAVEIKAFVTGAARRAYETIAPQFERSTGHKLVTDFELPLTLVKKVEAGEPFDIIILSFDVDGLIKQGKVVADSRTVMGRVGVGVAVRTGAPKPDFSTVEAFKRSLLDAKSIATSGEGSSGRYVASLLDRLGIADQVKPKIKSGGSGASAQLLSQGEVDFVVSGLPPLIGTPNIEWLGYLPPEINSWLSFTGGVGTSAKEPEAGRALLKFLTTPAALGVWKENGLEPAQ
jgi:molybdate transport system substrate-binding protein